MILKIVKKILIFILFGCKNMQKLNIFVVFYKNWGYS